MDTTFSECIFLVRTMNSVNSRTSPECTDDPKTQIGKVARTPHGGGRPFHQKSTCLAQLILGPDVVQMGSRNPQISEATRPSNSTVWAMPRWVRQASLEMCSSSEAGSCVRLIDVVYHSTLDLRVIKKKKDIGVFIWTRAPHGTSFGVRWRVQGPGDTIQGLGARD